MSGDNQPPSNPIFDSAPGLSTGVTKDPTDWYGLARTDKERELLNTLKPRLERLQTDNKVVFRPNLLLRTYVGDSGARPYGGVFWESPDIWVAAGDPSSTPAVPPNAGGNPVVGQPNTLYAHVWNLGLAPLAGVSVEFLVFNPSISFAGQVPLFRAVTRVDLAGRSAPTQCHKLVKCPKAWVPTVVNNGHECAIVRVSGVGDTLQPAHQFEPAFDRHVGQRNLNVEIYGGNQQQLLSHLKETLPRGAQMTFQMVGQEAQNTVNLVAPGLRINPQIKTVPIESIGAAPKPARGQATVVRIQGVTRDAAGAQVVVGGYTLVLVA
jgi:hypothetical protein